MAQVINTNVLSLKTINNLNKSKAQEGNAIDRLASGLRINSAADDAAGETIANRFTAIINGLGQGARNASDGISLAQTTEGALGEINSNLQRIRVLTVQAQNATNSPQDLQSIQQEIDQSIFEIETIAQQTQFNSVHILARNTTLSVQVGAHDGEKIDITTEAVNAKALKLDQLDVVNNPRLGGAVDKTVVTTSTTPPLPTTSAKIAILQADGTTPYTGVNAWIVKYNYGGQTKYAIQMNNGGNIALYPTPLPAAQNGNVTFSLKGLTPLNTATDANEIAAIQKGTTFFIGKNIDVPTAPTPGTNTAQVVPKGTPIALNNFVQTLQPAPTTADGSPIFTDNSKVHYLFDASGQPNGSYVLSGSDGNFYDISISPAGLITLVPHGDPHINTKVVPLKTVDQAISKVDVMRGKLGAAQNSLASAITSNNNAVQNLSESRSRIEDADYAVEVSNSTRAQILQQATMAVLTQANQVPENVLKLLKGS